MNQNNSYDTPQLGYFLDYNRHWLQALDLLKYQLQTKKGNGSKKGNRHFNTLEMFYYEKLEEFFEKLESEEYFKTRIVNNLFYGLKEFAVVRYTIPKSNLGLRHYNFMTCPMRVLYYAVGLYLFQLSQEYLREYYKSRDHIHANYGGHLHFENGKLNLNLDNIFYQKHYKEFRRSLRQEIKGNPQRKVVIYLDIENYFDELSIPKLLDLLEKRVKPSIRREMRYDETTQGQLVSFFDFVSGGATGIPQSDNNVISGFIGHLFLAFGDSFFDDELHKKSNSVENYAIIRYVDDIYISITFREQDNDLRDQFLNSLAPRISDCFYENLGLRLNPKTRFFDLGNEEDRNELERNLKKVSQGIEIADEENNEQPADKIEKIFRQLKRLKNSSIDPHFQGHRELEEEVLKEVYNEKVQQMLKKPDYKTRLKEIFMSSDGFDFELVNAYPLPIIILILECDDVRKKFEKFLLSKENLTSRDVYLILSYLCQMEFDQVELLELLKRSLQMKEVMEIFEDSLPPKLIGYYGLRAERVSKIAEPNVTEQIRLRVLCELKEEYSVALNHLLNELQAICYVLDKGAKGTKKYEANQVATFLRNQNVSHKTQTQIRNLFDRRNKSPVSHADPIAWTVTKDEYVSYRSHVGDCLRHLKQTIEEFQPPAWQELKQLYGEKLEEVPYAQEGYIKIEGKEADVIIIISEYSVDRIEQLAGIDLEINLKFRPLYFLVEYKFSEKDLELDDFERFY